MQVKRWAVLQDFNPLSSQQVMKYLKHRGYKIPKDRKTRKETTSKESLTQLSRWYPHDRTLERVVHARHLAKAIGYLDDSRLGRDGKFHPTYTFAPDTGRLASINPNFQNQPKHGVDEELARAIRETVIPTPGLVLVELDWKAIEAVLTGFFAGDEGFMGLSLVDSHSFLGWHVAWREGKIPAPPPPMDAPDLAGLLARFKQDFSHIRELAKKVNHATSYGMGPRHLADTLRISMARAQELMRIKDESAPKVAEWKNKVRLQAHNEGFLENPFGYRRYFTHVYIKDKYGQWKLGDEANKCLAFLPQSTAAGMLRDVVSRLPELPGYGESWHPLVPIHDALLLEVLQGEVPVVTSSVQALMEKKWDELNGLSIPVDIKYGSNWAAMRN